MEQITLSCRLRERTGSAASRRLRRDARVPAVVYGHKEKPVHLSLDRDQIEKLLRSGTRTAQLDIEGGKEPVLFKKVQYDALGESIIHIDFARITMDERVELAIPLETFGTAKGTRHGGVLDLVRKELVVSCLATNIPEQITLKVAELDIGDHILVKDIELPEGVTTEEDPETAVIVLHPPTVREVELEEEAEAEAATAPEVIGKGKEDEEEKAES